MDGLISRQAAIDALDVLCQEHRYKIPGKFETYSQYNEAWQDALDRAEGAIGNLPTVHPEPPKMGKWIQDENDSGKWYCSECGERTTETIMGMPRFKYCPMCGTCLGGEDDESRGI